LKSIQSRRLKVREHLDHLIEQQKKLDSEKQGLQDQLRQNSERKSLLESQQNDAIELGNYDKAEEFSNSLDEIRRENSETYIKILELSKIWIQFEKEKPKYFDKIIEFEESIINESEALKDEQQQKVEEMKKILRNEREDGEYKLGSEEGRIEKKN